MTKIKKFIPLFIAILTILSFSILAYSSSPNNKGSGVASGLVSNGVFITKDETTGEASTIDSRDFYYLADSIDSTNTNLNNEVTTRIQMDDDINTKIGPLDSLQTTSNSNLVSAVNDCFTSVANGKILLASTLATKIKL